MVPLGPTTDPSRKARRWRVSLPRRQHSAPAVQPVLFCMRKEQPATGLLYREIQLARCLQAERIFQKCEISMSRCIQLRFASPNSLDSAWLTCTIAFDDQTSTFIIPSGAGFEVVFCPGARSTTILSTSRDEMLQLSQQGKVDKQATMGLKRASSGMSQRNAASGTFRLDRTLLAVTIILTGVASARVFC